MRQNKHVLILLLLLVVTAALGMGFSVAKDETGEQEAVVMATDFSVGEVQGLVLKNSSGSVGLINTPAGVMLQEGDSEIYSQDKLKMLIYTLAHLTAQREIPEADSFQQEFGLNQPLAQAGILLPDETIWLALGRQNPISGEYYLSVDGQDYVYMIDEDAAALMLQSVQDLRDLSLYPTLTNQTIPQVTQIKVTNKSGSFILQPMAENNAGVFFGLVSPVEAMLDWERVDSRILNPLRELYPEKFVSDDVPLSDYGLDNPDLILEVTMGDRVYRSGFTQKDPDTWYCADLEGSLVSQVSNEQVAFLQGDFMDLLGGSIYSKSVADISRISMKYAEGALAMDITGEASGLTASGEAFQLDQQELLDFYSKIDSIPAAGILDGTETAQPSPILTISITLRDRTEDILEFYPISQRQCAVYLNGLSEFSTYTTVVNDMITAAESLKQSR